MRILIVTMHRGNNFGSALQVYALSETLKNLGHNPVVLDYIPRRINFRLNLGRMIKNLFLGKSLHGKYEALRGIMILVSSQRQYNRFFKEKVNLTRPYYSYDELVNDCPVADIYMTGSDQVWNSFHNGGIEYVFFLDFVPEHAKRISYAASFGKERLDEWEISETTRLLKKYQAISVRESSALTILKNLGITNGVHVLDPTLLLSKEEWLKRIPKNKEQDKYLLIYSVEPNKTDLIEYAKLIANRLNLKIYLVEWGLRKYPGVDKMLSLLPPLELMSYFANAEFIVASSFHGTAFSINMNKQFISVAPKKFSTRAKSLLDLVSLSDRYVEKGSFKIERAISTIDYKNVNDILSRQREISKSFLVNAIGKEI
jgi:Uncharacterized conserved protein